MKNGIRLVGASAALLTFGQVAMATVHASAPVSVPVDAPWAMAGLVGLITVVALRFVQARKK